MQNNKYDNYYSRKSINELIIELQLWKDDITKSDWYEALKLHLIKRELTENEKKQFKDIISPDKLELILEKVESTLQEKSKNIILPTPSTESDFARKNINRFESLEKRNALNEQKLYFIEVKMNVIGKKMMKKFSLLIFLIIFNAIMFAIEKSIVGNEYNIGSLDNPSSVLIKSNEIVPIILIVNLITIVITIIIELDIIENFKDVGKPLKN